VRGGYLLARLGGEFQLLTIGADAPEDVEAGGITARRVELEFSDNPSDALRARYAGSASGAVYLIRPDQHVAGRWPSFNESLVRAALLTAIGKV
jgi:3-(3-hydroxy-phenyl)propionate hydroxylase